MRIARSRSSWRESPGLRRKEPSPYPHLRSTPSCTALFISPRFSVVALSREERSLRRVAQRASLPAD
jgi:hypothetical protein